MITGTITADGDALVKVTLILKRKSISRQAVVDTGFNGYLSVPENLVKHSGWHEFGVEEYELATGQIVRQPVFIGKILFNRKKRMVLCVQTKAKDILIGTKLLSGLLCEFDYGSRIVRMRSGNILR